MKKQQIFESLAKNQLDDQTMSKLKSSTTLGLKEKKPKEKRVKIEEKEEEII